MRLADSQQPSVILKHAFLASLRDQNQVLFYRLMQDHLKELLGVLYTPGAAEAYVRSCLPVRVDMG